MEAAPKEDPRNDGRTGKASSPPKIYRKTVAKIGGCYELLRKRWSERRDSNHHCKFLIMRNFASISQILHGSFFPLWRTLERFSALRGTNWHKRVAAESKALCLAQWPFGDASNPA